jgi:hypothetical protein
MPSRSINGSRIAVGVVIAHPKQLRGSEAGQHRIGRLIEDHIAPSGFVDPVHLRLAALVAPDQRRPHDSSLGVKQHQTVHLSRKANAGDVFSAGSHLGQNRPHRIGGRLPPVIGMLFGPQRPLHVDVVVRRRHAARNTAIGVNKQRAGAAGADVETQPVFHCDPQRTAKSA